MEQETFESHSVVAADFSQFYVRIRGGLSPVADDDELSLAYYFEPNSSQVPNGLLLLSAARQWGYLPVTVRVTAMRPSALESSWRDVVEISLCATDHVTVTGWEETGLEEALPLIDGRNYRLRYSISDADDVDDDLSVSPREKYLVELWPEEFSPAAVITQLTKKGRYWRISMGLDQIGSEIYHRNDGATLTERVSEFANRAFSAFPDLHANVVDDMPGARSSMASTAVMLAPVPRMSTMDLVSQREYAARVMSDITKLLVECAMKHPRNSMPES